MGRSLAFRMQPHTIPITTGRPNCLDPRSHYWYSRDDGCLVRVCDGKRWYDAPSLDKQNDLGYCIPCLACQGIYVDSVANGNGRLQIVDAPLNYGMDSPNKVEYTHLDEYASENKGSLMNSVPMATFARFYSALPSAQPRIVREARLQQATPGNYMGRDYYGPLRNMLRTAHWKTNDIAIVEDAIGPLINSQKSPSKKKQYRDLGKSYMDFWIDQKANFFLVPPVVVSIAGLEIRVKPELGMRTDTDALVLKLWFNQPRPTRAYRQAIQYMMEQASSGSSWQQSWQPAIWDVRRMRVLHPIRLPRDFVSAIEGQAASFLHIWNSFSAEEY